MKRYLAFFGLNYNADGGMDDFLIDCDSIDECEKVIDEKIKERFIPGYETIEEFIDYEWNHRWAHIYDIEQRKIVWSK